MENFVFDGCTFFPDRILGVDLTPCCLEHDIAFWTHESPTGPTDFITANLDMLTCFANTDPLIGTSAAIIAALGVFTGGLLFWRRGKRGSRWT